MQAREKFEARLLKKLDVERELITEGGGQFEIYFLQFFCLFLVSLLLLFNWRKRLMQRSRIR